MAMEQIVRPFTKSAVVKTTKLTKGTKTATPTVAHLCWGAPGTIPEAVEQDDPFTGISFRVEECDDNLTEQARDVEDVKISDSTNPNKYIIVERIRKIQFGKKTKKKMLTTFQTDTTVYAGIDAFAGSAFGSKPLHESCKSSFRLNR